MTRSRRLIPAVVAIAMGASCHLAFGALPVGLRCESIGNPAGIERPQPRLSWRIESEEAGMRQTAYQIEVTGAWDSGRVESDRSTSVPYGGAALESGKTYQWRVRVWDDKGAASPWSETARWTMGKLQPGDWSARWIGVPEHPAAPSLDGVKVTRATYRTHDGKVEKDVTALMRRVVDAGAQTFSITYGRITSHWQREGGRRSYLKSPFLLTAPPPSCCPARGRNRSAPAAIIYRPSCRPPVMPRDRLSIDRSKVHANAGKVHGNCRVRLTTSDLGPRSAARRRHRADTPPESPK